MHKEMVCVELIKYEKMVNDLKHYREMLKSIYEKTTLIDDEDIDYLQLYFDIHPTYEERAKIIFKSVKEHTQLIQTYTDDERVLAQCNLILKEIDDE